jgi:Protein of unknown function (DUF2911)
MKQLILSLTTLIAITAFGQGDNTAKPSPAANVSETISSGAVVTINYSQPSVKGRTIGKDLEPKDGKIWRAGANDATVFEVSKDVKVEGKDLPAGKYGFFILVNGEEWTMIFNKTWKQWGAFSYKDADDALRVNAKSGKANPFSEKLTYTISKGGKVSVLWGDKQADFMVK